MTDTTLGSLAEVVNSQAYKLFVSLNNYTDNQQFIMLQDCSLDMGETELDEPTTAGGLALFSSVSRPRLTGTLLYNSSQWTGATLDSLNAMLVRTNGERPTVTWQAKLTDQQGAPVTRQFQFLAKTEGLRIYKASEGGTKVDIALRIKADPTIL